MKVVQKEGRARVGGRFQPGFRLKGIERGRNGVQFLSWGLKRRLSQEQLHGWGRALSSGFHHKEATKLLTGNGLRYGGAQRGIADPVNKSLGAQEN